MDETVKMASWNDCDSNRSTQENIDYIGRGSSAKSVVVTKFLVKKDTACTFTKTSSPLILHIIKLRLNCTFPPIVCKLCDFAPYSFKRAILHPILFSLSDFMIPMTCSDDVSVFDHLMCATCVILFF